MKEKESHKSIFTLTELADYLGVTRQAISLYKKNNPKRFELMLLGFAAKKLDISYIKEKIAKLTNEEYLQVIENLCKNF